MFRKNAVNFQNYPVRNCFTFAMKNKLVVIINSLKVPKIKKILLYEMKFLVPNYSCLQNPWLGGYRPQIPAVSEVCPQLNLLYSPRPTPNKIPGYATDCIKKDTVVNHVITDKHVQLICGTSYLSRAVTELRTIKWKRHEDRVTDAVHFITKDQNDRMRYCEH